MQHKDRRKGDKTALQKGVRQDRTKKEGRPDRAKKKSEARPRQKFFGYPAVKDRNNSNPYPA